MSYSQRRLLAKDLKDAAQTIDLNSKEPAVKSSIDFFNKMQTGNTVYVWRKKPGKYWGATEQAERVELPYSKKLGRRYTATDVRKTLKENPKLTLEELLLKMGAIE
jgi:hypothetical protein